jgi:hypothetical protein
MKIIVAGLCALLAFAPTARAQDLTTQYAAAHLAFLNTSLREDPLAQRQLIAQTLLDLQGRWFPASVMQQNDPQLRTDLVQSVCESSSSLEITAPTPYQFLMTRTDRRGNTMTHHFDYVVSNIFQLHIDDNEYATYVGIADNEERMAQIMQSAAGRFGPYAMYHPSPDILVMQPSYGPPDIYARCPT